MVTRDAPRRNSSRAAVTPASGAEKSDPEAVAVGVSLTVFVWFCMALVCNEQC
jgi:hypothetical protein